MYIFNIIILSYVHTVAIFNYVILIIWLVTGFCLSDKEVPNGDFCIP